MASPFDVESAVKDFWNAAPATAGWATDHPVPGRRRYYSDDRVASVSSSGSNFVFAAGVRQACLRWAFRYSAPSGVAAQENVCASNSATACLLRLQAGGTLQIGTSGGTFITLANPLAPDVWHWLDLAWDQTGTTYTHKARLNGGATQTHTRTGMVAADLLQARFFYTGNNACVWEVADMQATDVFADYPLADLPPTSFPLAGAVI